MDTCISPGETGFFCTCENDSIDLEAFIGLFQVAGRAMDPDFSQPVMGAVAEPSIAHCMLYWKNSVN